MKTPGIRGFTSPLSPQRQRERPRIFTATLVALALLLGGGCGANERGSSTTPPGSSGGKGSGGPGPQLNPGLMLPTAPGSGGSGNVASPELEITPPGPLLTVSAGQPVPTVQLQLLRKGVPVAAPRWLVQDSDIGSIDESGTFTPKGDVGGETTVYAYIGVEFAKTLVSVKLLAEQNGGVDSGTASAPGGYDGVGGEGPGKAVDGALRGALDGTPLPAGALSFLYPYDETVFPLELFAPLLMWTPGDVGPVEGVRLRLFGKHYEYSGYFGRPPALAAGQPFVRHPIPQDVWRTATRSSRGGELNVELTLASSGKAYGPLRRRFIIANGSLKGTVYYQSYGTSLALNFRAGVGGRFGAATLAIRPGEAAPRLIAGKTTEDDGGCRVCHTVSSQGTRMVVQQGSRGWSSSYDLLNGNVETPYAQEDELAWIGLTPDGALGLSNARRLGLDDLARSELRDMVTGEPVASTGFSDLVTIASFPAFSPTGDRVAFNFETGPGNALVGAGDGRKLVSMRFDRASLAFSEPTLLYQGGLAPGWPSFSPDGGTLVFQTEVEPGAHGYFESRSGGKGELWWVNLHDRKSYPLRRLNGDGYLPTGEKHDADQVLNYEPTVSPIATGGYAWIVFMSRRLYGNVATAAPWDSDPRRYDHTKIITPKKLWVAAIDLNVDPAEQIEAAMRGEDPSHPAFYLPGQELYAGNSRGFWVQDPCKADGVSCESGVDCCSGFCQADLETGEPTCGKKKPGCVEELNRCESDADCCDTGLRCINSVCSLFRPPVK